MASDDPSEDPRDPSEDPLLTYEVASRRLGVPLGTMYALVHAGRIPHVRLGKRLVRFRRADLERWLESNSVPAGKAVP